MAKAAQRHPILFKSLPKVELHRHLEGSLRLTTIIEAAKEFDIDVPHKNVEALRSLVQVQDGEAFTHQNFLSKFETLRKFYRTPEMIQRITREMVADAAADNVRYMEIRFTPVALTRINEQPLGDAMDWVIEAAEKASKEYGVKTRLIASVNRHESVELAEEVAKLAAERIERGVAALDLAGAEADFPGDPFKQVFETAKKAGLRITIHAGEWSGPGNVVEAIKELGAERIGHGVRVLEDKKAVNLAKERKTVFEVCVTSNYQSGVVPALKDHPLPQMLAAGLNATINTDDPGISQIDLSDEYELACDGLGLSLAQLKESILNAARAAFLQQSEREALVKQLQAEFKENGA